MVGMLSVGMQKVGTGQASPLLLYNSLKGRSTMMVMGMMRMVRMVMIMTMTTIMPTMTKS